MKISLGQITFTRKLSTFLTVISLFITCIVVTFAMNYAVYAEQAFAAETEKTNAGFVNGIWFSKLPFFADETVRIYVAFQNQSGNDITGKIEFYDNGKRVDSKEFSALSSRLVEGWSDFAASYGNHKISVKLADVKKTTTSGGSENIIIDPNTVEYNEIFVDYDTDNDEIGNKDDTDDDDDGFSDKEEDDADTDPLNKKDYPKKSSGGDDNDNDDSKVLGVQFVNSVKDAADNTVASINTGADSLNEKIKNKIGSIENELNDLKNKNNGIKQTILEGRAEITAPAETKQLSRKIALKTGELYFFKTLFGILEYKILLYLVILLIAWFAIKGIWNFFRR